jgi:hypothetical protein
MANFTTHIAIGTVVSGTAATLTLAANVISPESLIAVTLAGVLGGVLPDIDLKDSRPSRAMFSGLAIFTSFCVLFAVAARYSIAEMWIAWLGTLMLVRYGAHMLFHHFSYHRGVWHSLLAGVFWWFMTAIVYHRLLGYHEGVAWLAGGFLFLGYLTHLILDEIYSVDVMDTRVKASFGTALKLWDSRHISDSVVVGLAAVGAFALTPPSTAFVDGITSRQLWAGLHQRLLPQDDKWFGIILPSKRIAGPAARAVPATDITTGSIKPPEFSAKPEGLSDAMPERPAAMPEAPAGTEGHGR